MKKDQTSAQSKRSSGREATGAYLIEQARRLFQAKGYKDTSINELVEVAGGSKETVYRHFRDKKALLEAVFEAEAARHDDMMGGLDDESIDATPRGLTDYATGVLLELTSDRAVGLRQMMIAESQTRPEVGRLFYSRYLSRGYDRIQARLSQFQEHGLLRPMKADRLTEYFVAMLLNQVLLKRQCDVIKPLTKIEARRLAGRIMQDFLTGFGARR